MAEQVVVTVAGDKLLLAGVLDFDTVSAVDQRGQQWLQGEAPQQCVIDLSGITYSGSVGIALLLGWLRIAQQQKKQLRIQQLPKAMSALIKVGGLDDVLG